MSTFDILLHPTDFSEDSDCAFQLACSVARDQFASLVIVHVLPPEMCPTNSADLAPGNDETLVMQACYDHFCRMKSLAGEIPISFRLVYGYAVGAILNVAHEEKADLIVIASHQHSHFHLQLHGSVTEGLLRQSHCPIIVFRHPEHRAASRIPSMADLYSNREPSRTV